MKEFNAWFNENKQDWPLTPHDENDCGDAWKAALEWVLTQKFEYDPKYCDNTEVILANRIEKELQE